MDNRQVREKMFDTMIKLAGREFIRTELAALPAEDSIDYTFSPKFDRNMKKLFGYQRRIKTGRRAARVLKIMAAMIAVVAVLFVTAFAFVPEFQEEILNIFLEWRENSARITFSDMVYTDTAINTPVLIPQEFKEVERVVGKSTVNIWYTNKDGQEIIFTLMPSEDGESVAMDHENSEYSLININGLEGHLFASNSIGYPSYVLFDDGVFAYLVAGEVPVDLLIDMAKSIK